MIGPIGAMKITTDIFYRVNGMSTQFRGIKPHIELPDIYGYIDSGEKSLEYAIAYAEIPAVKYKKWKKHKYDIESLAVKSDERVKKNKRFEKITKSVEWSKERKENSKRSLRLADMEAYRKEAREVSEKYKMDDQNEAVIVDSIKPLKTEVEKESFKEFREELQKDPVVEETLNIFSDMLKS